MANQRMWEEIISNPMSTPAQVAAAEGQLHRILNPDRSQIVTAEPTAQPAASATPAATDWWSGKGPMARDNYFRTKRGEYVSTTIVAEPDNPAWSREAQNAFELATFPEFWA